ncbi:MAG: SpoIIE family protein phosphatase [Acidimicrobiia bacterium]|nr:SpoIIE family protein phosphatase [Acidimicrobiia bacterium]
MTEKRWESTPDDGSGHISPWWPYLLAGLVAAASLLMSWWLGDMSGQSVLVWNIAGVALVVAVAGARPAALTLIITTIGAPLVGDPGGFGFLQSGPELLRLGAYLTAGGLVLLLGERMRTSRLQLAGALAREVTTSRLLETERTRLAAVIEHLPNGVIISDTAGRMTHRNRMAAEITGAVSAAGPLVAAPLTLRKDGRPLSPDDWPITRSLRDGETVHGEEVEFVRPGGEHGVLRASSAPLHDASGGAVAAVMVFADVTERRRLEDAARLAADVATALGSDRPLSERLRSVAHLVVPRLGDTCLIEVGGSPRLAALAERLPTGLGPALDSLLDGRGEGLFSRLVVAGEPYLAAGNGAASDRARFTGRPEIDRILLTAGWCSVLIAPISIAGVVVGAVVIGCVDADRRFGASDRKAAVDVAARVGAAVYNSRLIEEATNARLEEERSSGLLRSLQDATAAAAYGLTTEEVVAALQRSLDMIGVDRTWVAIADGNGDLRVVSSRRGQGVRESTVDSDGDSPLAYTARTGRAMWHPPIVPGSARSARAEEMAAEEGLGAAALLPLAAGTDTLGALGVGFTDRRVLTVSERRYLGSVAAVMARSLHRARRYHQEHDVAEALQRALLPRVLPRVPGLEVAARYLTDIDETIAGGDWYELTPIDDTKVAVVLGDVVGHGVKAASVMVRLRSVLEAYLVEGEAPRAALARLDAVVAKLPEALGTTVVCAVIDLEALTLTYGCAGHPPPIRLSGTEVLVLGGATTVPLGVGSGQPADVVVPLSVGDRLVFYSDGLIERRGENMEVGLGHLAGLIGAMGELTPQEMASEILAALVGDEPVGDDVSLLVIRVAEQRSSSPPIPRPTAPETAGSPGVNSTIGS